MALFLNFLTTFLCATNVNKKTKKVIDEQLIKFQIAGTLIAVLVLIWPTFLDGYSKLMAFIRTLPFGSLWNEGIVFCVLFLVLAIVILIALIATKHIIDGIFAYLAVSNLDIVSKFSEQSIQESINRKLHHVTNWQILFPVGFFFGIAFFGIFYPIIDWILKIFNLNFNQGDIFLVYLLLVLLLIFKQFFNGIKK